MTRPATLRDWTVRYLAGENSVIQARSQVPLFVPDRSSAVLTILKIGRKASLRGRGASMRDALAQAQYPAWRPSISPSELLLLLQTHPSLVEDWVAYSEDKRTSGGFYVLRTGEIGQVGNQLSRRRYPSIEEAVAEFVLQELDYWQSLPVKSP